MSHEADRYAEALDLLGPHRGECAFCGGEDARHRVLDAIAGAIIAGDHPAAVAEDYDLPRPGCDWTGAEAALWITVGYLADEVERRTRRVPVSRWRV